MRIRAIKACVVRLPFRFSFGHALASRSDSYNVITQVEVLTDDGERIYGFGECVPRDYVTGETVLSVLGRVQEVWAPHFEGRYFSSAEELILCLNQAFDEVNLTSKNSGGAAFCTVELALLDALGKVLRKPLYQFLPLVSSLVSPSLRLQSEVSNEKKVLQPAVVNYGGVVPFASPFMLSLLVDFYKYYGFSTIKLKVGASLDKACQALALLRARLGEKTILRVDANCAWSYDEARWSLAAMRPYNVASVEQPFVVQELDLAARLVPVVPETIVADESLTTLSQASSLIARGACGAFNIRISKVGGIIAALRMIDLAQSAGMECHLGAQVGESGILASAQRHLASVFDGFVNVEGAMNHFLLKEDLTLEDLTVPAGAKARPSNQAGLGVRINTAVLKKHTVPLRDLRNGLKSNSSGVA
jgi:muconate cycloisomerase